MVSCGGLYTAIVGGFFVSALGGSRFQIGGAAGAFVVLVAATVQAHGMDGLILAVILSGLMLMAVGLLRLGTYIKFIPYRRRSALPSVSPSSSSPARSRTSWACGSAGRSRDRSSRNCRCCGPACRPQIPRPSFGRGDHRPHRRPQAGAAALAGHADRRGGDGLATVGLGLPVATIGTAFGGRRPPRDTPRRRGCRSG